MWHAFTNKWRFVEELSASVAPFIALWGLALGFETAVTLGIVLILLSAALNQDRWQNLGLIAVAAIAGGWLGGRYGFSHGAAYGILAVDTFHIAFLAMARASLLENLRDDGA